ncbi:hypothetical protein NESM_000498300 [Novymonas esmeraldas]|uniref:Uncharacterized protein n=1 Tax=Novymonas esmeraldas TaxID=1808958 RepID=A0AAW0EPP8_9TRYP
MERVESTLSALMPALEKHRVGSWKAEELERLCAMLRDLGGATSAKKNGAVKGNGAAAAPAVSSPSPRSTVPLTAAAAVAALTAGAKQSTVPSSSSSRAVKAAEPEDDSEDEDAFIGAVGEVDRCLNLVRDFLKRRVPFGTVKEPTIPAGAARPMAPHASTLRASADATASKKRARSPDPESAAPAPPVPHDGATVPTPVYAVDAFLYSEHDIGKLVDAKQLMREYCCRCGSTNLGLTEFITHSLSQDQLIYLGCFLFPHLLEVATTTTNTTTTTPAAETATRPASIVDIGSRLGVVVWACAFALQWGLLAPATDASATAAANAAVRLIGIELDPDFIKISHDVVRRFFAPRRRHAPKLNSIVPPAPAGVEGELVDVSSNIQMLQSDCFEGAGAAAMADSSIAVMHNVFEYFCTSKVEHARCWLKLRRLVCRPGQFLVCSPALEDTFSAFTDDVWAEACRLEGVAVDASASSAASWLADYVVAFDISDVTSDFLTLRALSRGGHEEEEGESHSDSSGGEDADAAATAEVEEQIRRLYVYNVR